MNRTFRRLVAPCTSQMTMLVVGTMALVASLACLTGGGAGTARAAVVVFDHDVAHHFPILGGTYQSINSVEYPSAQDPIRVYGLRIVVFDVDGQLINVPPSPMMEPDFVDTDAKVSAVVQFNPGKLPELFRRLPDDKYRYFLIEAGAERLVLEFKIEQDRPLIDAVSEDGESLKLRESPTLPSLGEHRVSPLSDGTYRVDGFFDIWTEISLDGGATFHPADSPLRLELTAIVPEPPTMILLTAGTAGSGLAARRRRRSCARKGDIALWDTITQSLNSSCPKISDAPFSRPRHVPGRVIPPN